MSKMLPEVYGRIANNAYYTPPAAIMPLLPFLDRDHVSTFVEPCCGEGHIVRVLKAAGLQCLQASDIEVDARDTVYRPQPMAFITNPPYDRTRGIMRTILENLRRQAPTWLLLESDFAFNRASVPHLTYCSDIVAVGRIKWITGSRTTGTANYAWFRFGTQPIRTCFHPRTDP